MNDAIKNNPEIDFPYYFECLKKSDAASFSLEWLLDWTEPQKEKNIFVRFSI